MKWNENFDDQEVKLGDVIIHVDAPRYVGVFIKHLC